MPDITINTTVPEEYVDRLSTMVQDKYMHPGNFSCTGLTVRECFAKMMIVESVKEELFQWERAEARRTATNEADASVHKIVVNTE